MEFTMGKSFLEKYFDAAKSRIEIMRWTLTIKQDSNNAEAYFRRGFLWDHIGQYKRGVQDYSEAIKRAKAQKLEEAYAYLIARASARVSLDDHAGAIDDYTEAIEMSENPLALILRGELRLVCREFDEAISDITEFIRRRPNDVQGYVDRAKGWTQYGKLDKAIDDYTRAIELDPNSAALHIARMKVKIDIKDYTGAQKDLDKAGELNPAYRNI
jgi:tetratricopeptide (TPR) repeat protein